MHFCSDSSSLWGPGGHKVSYGRKKKWEMASRLQEQNGKYSIILSRSGTRDRDQ